MYISVTFNYFYCNWSLLCILSPLNGNGTQNYFHISYNHVPSLTENLEKNDVKGHLNSSNKDIRYGPQSLHVEPDGWYSRMTGC